MLHDLAIRSDMSSLCAPRGDVVPIVEWIEFPSSKLHILKLQGTAIAGRSSAKASTASPAEEQNTAQGSGPDPPPQGGSLHTPS